MGRHTSQERRPRRRPGRRGLGATGAALLVGLIGSGAFIWHGTNAAFTASTSNGASSWGVGSVSLTEDGSGSALFTATNLKPGATGERCIVVTYNGTLAANVKLFASAATDPDTVAQYVKLTIQEGTGGSWGNCSGFASSGTLYNNGTLANLRSANGTYGTGLSSWAPNAPATTRTFRFSYTLDAATPDSKQGKNTTATFTWEAQNT